MNKYVLIIICFLFLFCINNVVAQDNPFPVLFDQKAKITIDGKFNDWPLTLPFILDADTQIKRGKRSAYNDIWGIIHCFFDKTNFYIFIETNDKNPLRNKKIGTDIWNGDCIEGYVGFREEEAVSYGEGDFQYGIALSPSEQQTWIWSGINTPMSGTEQVVLKNDTGCTAEIRIPLKNFKLDSISPDNPFWIDFAINNSDDGIARRNQIVWNGDGEGWSDPSVWRKADITDKKEIFVKPFFVTKLKFEPEQKHRLYIYDKGQPWAGGEVTIGTEIFQTDEKGGIDLFYPDEAVYELKTVIGGKSMEETLVVEVDRSRLLDHLPVKRIKVNQIGYHPKEKKVFIMNTDGITLASRTFEVVNKQDNKVVFTGTISDSKFDNPTHENLAYGDFSAVKSTGTFFIRMAGIDDSYPFEIMNNVFSDIFYTTMRSYYLQRCGIKVDDKKSGLSYGPCHLDDGYIKGTDKKLNVTHGWHDAGDYGKYMPTAGVTVAQLLLLYEKFPERFSDYSLDIPESGNKLPDIIDEIKVELDWMLLMQSPNGGVYHKVNTEKFPGTVMPEKDTKKRLIYEVGTNDTGIFCGAMALAARVFQSIDPAYAERLQQAAIKAGDFLIKNPGKIHTPSNDFTGAYLSSDSDDEQYWAFAELFRLTGETKYLDLTHNFLKKSWMPTVGWENTLTLGMYALIKSGKLPQKLKEKLLMIIFLEAERIVTKITLNGYGAALYFSEYSWASNKTACAYGLNLLLAYDFFYEKEYLTAARKQIDYIFGVNTLSKSFLTGMGDDPVKYPHHRITMASKIIVPGLLMGGPNDDAQDGKYPKDMGPKGYIDHPAAYSCNEYAIDYNAPLVFLAGYFMCLKDKSVLY
ncbi:MAG: glycoside hydrolase family 9 protein [Spirochaetales bacterium]|nr:glycoside hydrolase family 9 protein [Spirochaetales bacterium]